MRIGNLPHEQAPASTGGEPGLDASAPQPVPDPSARADGRKGGAPSPDLAAGGKPAATATGDNAHVLGPSNASPRDAGASAAPPGDTPAASNTSEGKSGQSGGPTDESARHARDRTAADPAARLAAFRAQAALAKERAPDPASREDPLARTLSPTTLGSHSVPDEYGPPWPAGDRSVRPNGGKAPNAFEARQAEALMHGMPPGTKLVHQDPLNLDPTKRSQFPSVQQVASVMEDWGKQPVAHDYIHDGCYARAHLLTEKLQQAGYATGKVFVLQGAEQPALQAHNRYYDAKWSYHVAPVVFMRDAQGKIEPRVLDRSFSATPMTLADWTRRYNPHGSPLRVELTQPAQYSPLSNSGRQTDFAAASAHARAYAEYYEKAHGWNIAHGKVKPTSAAAAAAA